MRRGSQRLFDRIPLESGKDHGKERTTGVERTTKGRTKEGVACVGEGQETNGGAEVDAVEVDACGEIELAVGSWRDYLGSRDRHRHGLRSWSGNDRETARESRFGHSEGRGMDSLQGLLFIAIGATAFLHLVVSCAELLRKCRMPDANRYPSSPSLAERLQVLAFVFMGGFYWLRNDPRIFGQLGAVFFWAVALADVLWWRRRKGMSPVK
jgi:hypothetical protein